MQGLRSQKKRSLHVVNEHFFDERNAAGGHYGQTLIIPGGKYPPPQNGENTPITVQLLFPTNFGRFGYTCSYLKITVN